MADQPVLDTLRVGLEVELKGENRVAYGKRLVRAGVGCCQARRSGGNFELIAMPVQYRHAATQGLQAGLQALVGERYWRKTDLLLFHWTNVAAQCPCYQLSAKANSQYFLTALEALFYE